MRISKLLLPLDAQPAKVRPASLFALREPLDQFEVDLGAVLLRDHAESLPRLGSRWAKLLDNLPDVSHLLDASGCLSGKTYGIKIDANLPIIVSRRSRPLTSLEEILLYAISIDLRLLESLIDPEHDQELECE